LNVEPIALNPELTLTQVAEIQAQSETKKRNWVSQSILMKRVMDTYIL